MPSDVEFRSRIIAQLAGYDPDKLVVRINQGQGKYLSDGFAPVDITKIKPIFMHFKDEAERQIKKETELAKQGQDITVANP